MLFNSLEYLLFLLIAFAVFWWCARSRTLRTLLLLTASYLFYMSWNASFIFLILASTTLDFFIGRELAATERLSTRRVLLGISLAGNLGALALFKYLNFGIGAVVDTAHLLGLEVDRPVLNVVLPVGISFYTFQTLSYTIDVYRGKLTPTKNFLDFATFVAFFPQLVAGPIVRARELLPQFDCRPVLDLDRAGNAAFLIARGMAKKILIADFLAANWIDRVWEDPGAYSTAEVWVAAFAYTWQLYADFSGYTDIARGSAKLFGFELPENFHRPFNSTGPIDFWRKWHVTLSTWIRDYVYVPLGGSRRGKARSYVNLFITFLLAGIWHGAGWTFVIFGLWHGVMVAANRFLRDVLEPASLADGAGRGFFSGVQRRLQGIFSALGRSTFGRPLLVVINLFLFVVHWPTFRSSSLDNMMDMYGQMFSMSGGNALRVSPQVWLVLIGFTVLHMSPPKWMQAFRRAWVSSSVGVQGGTLTALAGLLMWIGSQQQAPFIYFQF